MKKHKLIGLGIACLGAILYASGTVGASALLVIGVLWFIVGRAYD